MSRICESELSICSSCESLGSAIDSPGGEFLVKVAPGNHMNLESCSSLYAEEGSQAPPAAHLCPLPKSSVSSWRLSGPSYLGKATSQGVSAPGPAPAPVIAFCRLIPRQLN